MKLAPIISGLVGSTTIASAIFTGSPAHALTWQLNNFQFVNGTLTTINLPVTNPATDINTSVIANAGTATGVFGYDVANPGVVTNVNIVATLLGLPNVAPSTITYNQGVVTQGTSGASSIKFTTSSLPSTLSKSELVVNFAPDLTNTIIPPSITASIVHNSANTTNPIYSFSSGVNSGATLQTVPFEIPGGGTIPAVGSILALGVMRKIRKSKTRNGFIAEPVNNTIELN